MVHFTTLRKIFEEKPQTIELFRNSYVIYTIIILCVSAFVISSLEDAKNDETCEGWSILPNIPIADDGLTYQACTNLVSGSTEVTRVNGAAAFLALALFLIYFYFQATSLSLLGSVIPVLFVQDATTNHNPTKTSTNLNSHIAYAMRAYQGCKFVILICVEVVGLWMIFNSTSNHEVIINSTAAFFLCELDAYLLNCIVQKYLLVEPISGEYDVELINIEFSTGDIGPYFEQLKKKRNEQQSNATNEVIENQSSENPIVTSA